MTDNAKHTNRHESSPVSERKDEPSSAQPLIDAHHHLWALDGQVAYPWLEDSPVENFFLGDYAAIRQPFRVANLKRLIPAGYRLAGSVHCEAEASRPQAEKETRWIAEQAAIHGLPAAHVGWAAFGTDECAAQLDAQCESALFRGVRAKPVTAATPAMHHSIIGTAGSLQDSRWCEGLALLQERDLSWDLRVPAWHLEDAAVTLQSFSDLRVILNHTGLPWDRSREGLAQWRAGMHALSENSQVAIKLSELGTPWHDWDANANLALLCEALEIFGPTRCLFASNFPVSGLKVSYGDWLALVTGAIQQTQPTESRQSTLDKVLHDNAIHWYRLPLDALATR
ncbi:amidohydrolase family protein [Cobetia sp. L2A1]|uniref:amidohydrolase family protein n=1 Tax=Cobetia sp. L2A1 TaxID=2686360 RepID=UPI00131C5A9A|nr:amidohydrolase family protein [Cobetia sp. L2A1]